MKTTATHYRFILIMARCDKRTGKSEIDFINQFKATSQTIARKAYREA